VAPEPELLWAQPAPAWGTPTAGGPTGPVVGPVGQTSAFGPPQPTAAAGMPPWGAPASAPLRIWPMIVAAGVAVLILAGLVAGALVWHPWSDSAADRAPDAGAPFPAPSADGPTDPAPSAAAPTDPTPSTDAPTRPAPSGGTAQTRAWLAAANAYCRNTTDPELKKVRPLIATDPAGYFSEAAKINRRLDAFLRKDVPAPLRADVASITASWDELATLYEQAAKAGAGGDLTAADDLVARAMVSNEKGNLVARRIGLPDCADAGGLGGSGSAAPTITA
jgi:hypothetical protein